MPVDCKFVVEQMSISDFHELDYGIMRHAFDIQNDLGRLCQESIYQRELVHRCETEGLPVLSEGEISVSHQTFRKSYFIDALINRGAIYELKAVEAFHGQHEAQLLNYLFLTDLSCGKLINFSSSSVQHRFVTTNLERRTRDCFQIDDSGWSADYSLARQIRHVVSDLLTDWGAFLDIDLYRDALFHFLGGEEQLLHPVDISVGNRIVGRQKMHLLNRNAGLHISSTIRNVGMYRKQLLRILNNTDLDRMHWINFCRDVIYLITLNK